MTDTASSPALFERKLLVPATARIARMQGDLMTAVGEYMDISADAGAVQFTDPEHAAVVILGGSVIARITDGANADTQLSMLGPEGAKATIASYLQRVPGNDKDVDVTAAAHRPTGTNSDRGIFVTVFGYSQLTRERLVSFNALRSLAGLAIHPKAVKTETTIPWIQFYRRYPKDLDKEVTIIASDHLAPGTRFTFAAVGEGNAERSPFLILPRQLPDKTNPSAT